MVAAWLRREAKEERKAAKKMDLRNVLVALAGNSMDEDLMRMACTMAKNGKGHVIALSVVEVPRTLPLDAVVDSSSAENVLDRAIAVAQDMNVEIEAEVVQAREAGPAIVDEANDRQCRLILLGLVPRTRFGQFDLGKTVPYILEHAKGRVWIVRDDAEASATL
jgi:nucleotide-binding universal stress UspA family protein